MSGVVKGQGSQEEGHVSWDRVGPGGTETRNSSLHNTLPSSRSSEPGGGRQGCHGAPWGHQTPSLFYLVLHVWPAFPRPLHGSRWQFISHSMRRKREGWAPVLVYQTRSSILDTPLNQTGGLGPLPGLWAVSDWLANGDAV